MKLNFLHGAHILQSLTVLAAPLMSTARHEHLVMTNLATWQVITTRPAEAAQQKLLVLTNTFPPAGHTPQKEKHSCSSRIADCRWPAWAVCCQPTAVVHHAIV
jgi:hypothetical protein